jgi:hemolysin III
VRANERRSPPRYALGEEIANSVTHGVGTLLSVLGTGVLLYQAARQGTVLHAVSFAIYGATLIVLHLASTLYHGIRAPRARRVFWILDHCSIYLLIAGTYTPFLLLSLWGRWGATLLIAIWTLAATGIVLKLIFIGRFRALSLAGYIVMGWLIVVAAREVWLKVPHEALIFVAVGGVLYTLGTVFYGWKRLPYNHAIWHLFVLGGSVSHYFAVLLYLAPVG